MARGSDLQDTELYDITPGYDEETEVILAEGLTLPERQQAAELYRLFNGLWGVCIVVGDPGMGKDLFGNYLTWKLKRFFPWKRVLRDERPRPLYGPYAGLFNEQVLKEDLDRMREVAKGVGAANVDKVMEAAADKWMSSTGSVMLKDSILYLTEYWRYCYNREPHRPMNKAMGAVHKEKRHIDCLIIGTVQLWTELDKKTCLPWVDWMATCTRSVRNKTGFVYLIRRVKYDRRTNILEPVSSPFPIVVDAGKPRAELGDGKIRITRRGHDYRPVTEEERVVMEVLRAGVDTYDELVGILETDGDMTERETLDTLKELKFRRSKRAVDYPCFFGLYNSKSAPQVRATLRVED